MRVLTVTHYFASHKGGIEIVAEELARAMARQGDTDLTWLASDAAPPPDDFPGEVEPLRAWNVTERFLGFPMPLPFPSALHRIGRHLDKADALIIHDSLYLMNAAAVWMARRRKVPVLVIQHVGLVPYRNPVLRALMALGNRLVALPVLRRADRVVFISGITARYFEGRARTRHPPELIFNGLRRDLLQPLSDHVPDKPKALFVGRFVEKKGLPVVKAMARLRPDLEFTLCGWGPMTPEEWGLENVSVRRDLGPRDLASAYAEHTALVLPSVGEGLPLVVQEALAYGCQVLAGEDLLVADPGLTGEIAVGPVDHGDPEATATRWVAELDALPTQTVAARKDRAARARARYDWDAAARRYLDLLAEITGAASKMPSAPDERSQTPRN